MSPEDALGLLHRVIFDDKDDKEAAMTTNATARDDAHTALPPVVAADDWHGP